MNRPLITDRELLAHLRRRSSDPAAETDIWRVQLIAGVRSKAATQAEPVQVRRLPAFAGFLGVLAVLLLLVVAVPRLSSQFGGGAPSTPVPATPTPAPLGFIECTGDTPVTITDYIGEVVSCESFEVDVGTVGAPEVSNPAGALKVLELRWRGGECLDSVPVDFRATLDLYQIFVRETDVDCYAVDAYYGLRLHLAREVTAERVTVQVSQFAPGRPTTPTPAPIRQ